MIPNSVSRISYYSFSYCTNLSYISLGQKLNTIGSYAFLNCISLETIKLPNSVTTLRSYAFCKCSKLAEITLGGNLKQISEYTFSECSSLKSIKLPNSISIIENMAFGICSNLTTVFLGDDVLSIGDKAFSDCVSLYCIFYNGTKEPIVADSAFKGSPAQYVMTPSSYNSTKFGKLNVSIGQVIDKCQTTISYTPSNSFTQSINHSHSNTITLSNSQTYTQTYTQTNTQTNTLPESYTNSVISSSSLPDSNVSDYHPAKSASKTILVGVGAGASVLVILVIVLVAFSFLDTEEGIKILVLNDIKEIQEYDL